MTEHKINGRDYTGLTCGTCGVEHFILTERIETAKREKGGWFCPNGHNRGYWESEAERIRRDLDRAKQKIAEVDDERRLAWNTANDQKARADKAEADLKRAKQRSAHGVCSCCSRTFANVARHMKTKHAGVVDFPARAAALKETTR